MLSTPPAFILSQDQTLVISSFPQDQLSGWSILFYCFPLLPKQRRIKNLLLNARSLNFSLLRNFQGSLSIVQLSRFVFFLCQATAHLVYHIRYRLSRTFLIFLKFFQTSFYLASSCESACIYYHVVFCLSRVFFHFFTFFSLTFDSHHNRLIYQAENPFSSYI